MYKHILNYLENKYFYKSASLLIIWKTFVCQSHVVNYLDLFNDKALLDLVVGYIVLWCDSQNN